MRILGGTSTAARSEMSQFLRAAFGPQPVNVSGVDADLFDLPDGSSFAVADAGGMGTDRTIGFWVEGLEEAIDRLRRLGRLTHRSPQTSGGAIRTFVRQMATCTSLWNR